MKLTLSILAFSFMCAAEVTGREQLLRAARKGSSGQYEDTNARHLDDGNLWALMFARNKDYDNDSSMPTRPPAKKTARSKKKPTIVPQQPSTSPSGLPSFSPSGHPSLITHPSTFPSNRPSFSPSGSPSKSPSDLPSLSPSNFTSPGAQVLVISDIQIDFPACFAKNSEAPQTIAECVHNDRGLFDVFDLNYSDYVEYLEGNNRTDEQNEEERDKNRNATVRMRMYVQDLVATLEPKAIVNNGDLVHSALQSQLDIHKRLIGKQHFPTVPMYYGFGNHDLVEGGFNLSGVPVVGSRRCLINDMMNFLLEEISELQQQGLVQDFDMAEKADADVFVDYGSREINASVLVDDPRIPDLFERIPTPESFNETVDFERKGSFGYTFEIEDYVFIQMHWSLNPSSNSGPEWLGSFHNLPLRLKPFNLSFSPLPPNGFHLCGNDGNFSEFPLNNWVFDSIIEWLVAQLEKAKSRNKPVILLAHDGQGIRRFARQDTLRGRALRSALESSTAFAIISGHIHNFYGYFEERSTIVTDSRIIPNFYAGNPTYQKFLSLELLPNKQGMKVTIQDSARGEECSLSHCPRQDSSKIWRTVNLVT